MHQILFPASVCPSVRPFIRLFASHDLKNWRRFLTPKTDMAENDDDDAVAAEIMHL